MFSRKKSMMLLPQLLGAEIMPEGPWHSDHGEEPQHLGDCCNTGAAIPEFDL